MNGGKERVVRIGTRGSDLALAQARLVCGMLERAHAGCRCELVVISTAGDDRPDAPIGGAGWPAGAFTGAIERALRDGGVDLAVHSYKDMSAHDSPGLVVAAAPARAAVHDVLVTRDGVGIDDVPPGFRIGTGSPRRTAQIGHFCSGAVVVPIRGNVPTRIAKVSRGEVDGVVLAAAGLGRLGMGSRWIEVDGVRLGVRELDVERFVPCSCQGALAVQARAGGEWEAFARVIDDAEVRVCTDAERLFCREFGATCHTAVGVLARGGWVRAQVFDERGGMRSGEREFGGVRGLAEELRTG